MEVNSLAVILIAMAVGLVVGFELGQSVMRRRISEIVEKAAEAVQKDLEQKKKEREEAAAEVKRNLERLAGNWRVLMGQEIEKQKKEQNENESEGDI